MSLELNWSNTAPLIDMFDKGLSRKIKQSLCNYERPTSLAEFFKLVSRIDNRHLEFHQEFSNTSCTFTRPTPVINNGVEDMAIGATQRHGPLSSQE